MMTSTSQPLTPAMAPNTKSFTGNYLLWRKSGQNLRKGMPGSGGSPKFRHPSFAAAAAEIEAHRLLCMFPESSFVILQEVARVKLTVPDAGSDEVA